MNHSSLIFALGTLALVASAPRGLAAQSRITDPTPYLNERAAEVALARSSAPAHVSDSATILHLTRTGYIEAAKGTNGFVCLVIREFEASLTDFAAWAMSQNRAPHCLNPAAVRTFLPEVKYRAELVLAGMPIDTVRARITAAYASGRLKTIEIGAMAYMLSKHQVLGADHSAWKPHVMFYYPVGTPASFTGGGGMDAPVIYAGNDPLITSIILIPVPAWSDGTPSR